MAAAKENSKPKDIPKKEKASPKKERQISLRLSAKGAKRLNKLIDKTEWSVTQVIEEALKVYAIHEGITLEDKVEDRKETGTEIIKLTA